MLDINLHGHFRVFDVGIDLVLCFDLLNETNTKKDDWNIKVIKSYKNVGCFNIKSKNELISLIWCWYLKKKVFIIILIYLIIYVRFFIKI